VLALTASPAKRATTRDLCWVVATAAERVVCFLSGPLLLVNVAVPVRILFLIVVVLLIITILIRSTAGRAASQFIQGRQSLGSGLSEMRAVASDRQLRLSCGRRSGVARGCGLAIGKSVLPVTVRGGRRAPNRATGVLASTGGCGELTAAGVGVPEPVVVVVGRIVILIVARLGRPGHLAAGFIVGRGRSGTLGSAFTGCFG
jgi:hypothetical protein